MPAVPEAFGPYTSLSLVTIAPLVTYAVTSAGTEPRLADAVAAGASARPSAPATSAITAAKAPRCGAEERVMRVDSRVGIRGGWESGPRPSNHPIAAGDDRRSG